MPLINKPTEKTAEDVFKEIKQHNTQLFNVMKTIHNVSFRLVWENKDFEPSEIVSLFGTDAVALFQSSSQIQTILKAIDPDHVVLTPDSKYTVTPNKDGTVTITEGAVNG